MDRTRSLVVTAALAAGALTLSSSSSSCFAVAAFAPPRAAPSSSRSYRPSLDPLAMSAEDTARDDGPQSSSPKVPRSGRREALASIVAAAGAVVVVVGGSPEGAEARDELFKPNPLTNPVLEQVRIWEQAEADEIKYGGELAPGSPRGRKQYAELLVPILSIQRDLDEVYGMVREDGGSGLDGAASVLAGPQFRKINFKKTFNAFADNIYYSDPDRANLYLGGGATPKTEQSLAYLLRNDVLDNVEALQAEVAYLIKEIKGGGELETEDLYKYSENARDGMRRYLELVPPGELKMGRELFAAKS